ncbi:hypothetical protein EDM80_02820 [bacterium]|nr:MAG: hypothetical protein EDM80_02820 [bacterium]MCQ3950752.1 hypothetical protein [Planctomycetota bacterium]RIK62561.1 MAG: hypothetical protein DCC64_09725 [Planctomycetota bacterium]
MTRLHQVRAARRRRILGATLLEVAVAAVIIAIVAMAGTSYYLYARLFEIQAVQEQAGFNIVELEIESWQAEGYGALATFTTATIPFGYNSAWAVGDPRRVTYPRTEVREGMTYRVTATSLWNRRGGPLDGYTSNVDFRWLETAGGVSWEYRRIQFLVEWGPGFGKSVTIETRIAQ